MLGRDINLNAVAATSDAAVYLYDTTLNVTWLRDANANGAMDWATANAWAANLETGIGAAVISDWRLPTMAPSPNPIFSFDGSTAMGYNVPASSSEMASLFFLTLGNKSYLDTGGAPQVGYGLTNTGSFKNFVAGAQWYGTEYEPDHSFAWVLYNSWGGQSANFPVSTLLSAMAVRAGDVAPVPEPETYTMLLAGLLVVGAVARRRKVSSML